MASKQTPKSAVTETYTLPSLGKPYGDGFPSEVTIRSMTTFEEKMRLGNQGLLKSIVDILNAVITSPEDFNAENYTMFDFYFLMYKMRTVSYGSIYRVRTTCSDCGQSFESRVDLDDLPVYYLKDDLKEPFEVGTLPRSGDKIEGRFERVSDRLANDARSKEILRKHPDYVGTPDQILDVCSEIATVNGQKMNQAELELYVENMDVYDSQYLRQAYDHVIGQVGLSLICHDVCPHCGIENSFMLPLDNQFFRPTFDF